MRTVDSRTQGALDLDRRYDIRRTHELPVVLRRGAGVHVWDVRGRRYVDLLSVCSALNQGHNHPRIVAAAKRQLGRLALASRSFHHELAGPLMRRLCALTGLERAVLTVTGAEAVEMAVKAMRQWGYRVKKIPKERAVIIVADGNHHGRTTTIVGFSSTPAARGNFGPATPGFRSVPYGDARALDAAIDANVCGFLVEPIQGERGVRVPPPGYLRAARKICAERGVLLCLDEVQTGLGRTGKLFCADHESVRPDLMVLGKALTGGVYPASALLASAAVLDLFAAGSHCSTYGASPVACAAAEAALDVIERERLCEKAAVLGTHFASRLRSLPAPVREVRGRGLLLALALEKPLAHRFCDLLMRRGYLTKPAGDDVVRLSPPLVITRTELDRAFGAIAECLKKL